MPLFLHPLLLLLLPMAAPPPHGVELPDVLDRAAKAAEREIDVLSSVACTETVLEEKISAKDKDERKRKRVFDYLVMLDNDGGILSLTESRVEQGGTGAKKSDSKPLLASSGFATMMFLLHPYYQSSFQFADLGSTVEDDVTWRRLSFESVAGKRSPSVLRAGSREYPLSWRGELRIDEATGRIGSVHATLGAQLEEIGLESLVADVRYGAGNGPAGGEWLPQEAVIDLRTHHQHWHNVHTFAAYRKFEVTATEKRGDLK